MSTTLDELTAKIMAAKTVAAAPKPPLAAPLTPLPAEQPAQPAQPAHPVVIKNHPNGILPDDPDLILQSLRFAEGEVANIRRELDLIAESIVRLKALWGDSPAAAAPAPVPAVPEVLAPAAPEAPVPGPSTSAWRCPRHGVPGILKESPRKKRRFIGCPRSGCGEME